MSVSSTSPMSLPGLGGYDFSTIVQAMVQSYSIPMQQEQQQESQIQTQQKAWQQYSSLLTSFKTAADALNSSSLFTSTKASVIDNNLSVTSDSTAATGTYNITVNQTATQEVVGGGTSTGTFGTSEALAINGTNIYVTHSGGGNVTLTDVQSAINNANAGATASIINGQLLIANNKTGDTSASDNTFTIQDINDTNNSNIKSTTLEKLGIVSSGTLQVKQAGQDASVTVFGQKVTSHSNSFTNLVQGVSVTLNKNAGFDGTGGMVNSGNNSGAYSEAINVSSDTSQLTSTLQNFVTAWNNINSFVTSNTSVPPTGSTNVKAGILLGDYSLQSYQQSLVNAVQTVYPPSSGATTTPQYNALASFGITFQTDGSLSLDTNALSSALSAGHTQDLQKLLTTFNSGLVSQIDNQVTNLTNPGNGLLTEKLNGYSSQISQYNSDITTWQQNISTYQKNLQIQFANLSASLNQMNAQGSALSSMSLGSMMASTTSTSSGSSSSSTGG